MALGIEPQGACVRPCPCVNKSMLLPVARLSAIGSFTGRLLFVLVSGYPDVRKPREALKSQSGQRLFGIIAHKVAVVLFDHRNARSR